MNYGRRNTIQSIALTGIALPLTPIDALEGGDDLLFIFEPPVPNSSLNKCLWNEYIYKP